MPPGAPGLAGAPCAPPGLGTAGLPSGVAAGLEGCAEGAGGASGLPGAAGGGGGLTGAWSGTAAFAGAGADDLPFEAAPITGIDRGVGGPTGLPGPLAGTDGNEDGEASLADGAPRGRARMRSTVTCLRISSLYVPSAAL